MVQTPIEFWFDFSSSYAYFASLEIEDLAARHGRTVVWRPFMLGAAFEVTGAKGLSRTPLKKDYALNDWRRIARLRGVPFELPAFHPSVSLPAMRAFYHLERTAPDEAVPFAKAVLAGYFRGELDTADPDAVARLGANPEALRAGIDDLEVKLIAKGRSQEAVARGVFGSPWMFVDGEPFWGWDRLPMIDRWLSEGAW